MKKKNNKKYFVFGVFIFIILLLTSFFPNPGNYRIWKNEYKGFVLDECYATGLLNEDENQDIIFLDSKSTVWKNHSIFTKQTTYGGIFYYSENQNIYKIKWTKNDAVFLINTAFKIHDGKYTNLMKDEF